MKMSKIFVSLFAGLLITDIALAQYCESNAKSNRIYNIDRNLYLDQGNNIWIYNMDTNRMSDRSYKLEDIYGENRFVSVDTSINFNSGECNPKRQKCDVFNKAKRLVLSMGLLKAEPQFYGYIAYILTDRGVLKPVENKVQMIWGMRPNGTLKGISDTLKGQMSYTSSVFVPKVNQMFICIANKTTNKVSYKLIARKIKDSGLWEESWTPFGQIMFKGLFHMNGRTFGITDKNIVHEMNLNGNSISFTPISTEREFFNCSNSPTFVSRKRRNKTSRLSTRRSTRGRNWTAFDSRTDRDIALQNTTNDRNKKTQNAMTDAFDSYETYSDNKIDSLETSNLLNDKTETTTLRAQKLQNIDQPKKEEPKSISLLAIGVILAILLVTTGLVMIVVYGRRKGKGELRYITKSNDVNTPKSGSKKTKSSNKTLKN